MKRFMAMTLIAMLAALLVPLPASGGQSAKGAASRPERAEPVREFVYPANPQYEYPFEPGHLGAKRCPQGQVWHRGACRTARPLVLPF